MLLFLASVFILAVVHIGELFWSTDLCVRINRVASVPRVFCMLRSPNSLSGCRCVIHHHRAVCGGQGHYFTVIVKTDMAGLFENERHISECVILNVNVYLNKKFKYFALLNAKCFHYLHLFIPLFISVNKNLVLFF